MSFQTFRVFAGDDRPAMFNRGQSTRSSNNLRSSTLIDPATLGRPISQAPMGPVARPPLGRRASTGAKPLLDFGDAAPNAPAGLGPPRQTIGNTKSVFGVDTMWEREMAKLREIEAREAEEEKARVAAEMAEAELREKKKGKKKKGKGKGKEADTTPREGSPTPDGLAPQPVLSNEERASLEPPVLPAIPRNITRGPPPPRNEDEEDESEDESDEEASGVRLVKGAGDDSGWHAGSSDDEKKGRQVGPVRTTGVGPRYPNKARGRPSQMGGEDDDSDSDVPLSAAVERVLQRSTSNTTAPARLVPGRRGADESDEEKPLSMILDKAKLNLPTIDFDNLAPSASTNKGKQPARNGDDSDEDNEPLGVRASRFVSVAGGDDDEDDKPLGLHPDQQRKSQYQQMMYFQQQQAAAAAAQQQQMMMQAQMHQSMIFANQSMMGSGFFGPPAPMMPMNPIMPQMTMPISTSPPPPQDSAKYGRVDKWRREVT